MKKVTLLAAMAFATVAAQAQYTVEDPYIEPTAKAGKIFDVIIMNEDCVNKLTQAGKTVNAIGPNEETRHLWYWAGLDTGSASFPGIGWNDLAEGGYTSLTVKGDAGWSGAGFAIDNGSGVSLTHLTEETKFHLAYRTETTAPTATALILLDLDGANAAAKVSLGDPFNDNGAIYPSIAPKPTDEWQAIEIRLGDLRKIYPAFNIEKQKVSNWYGNIMSVLQGNTAGQNVSYDAAYFYTPEGSGIKGVSADAADIIYTGKTINVNGANGINVYDMQGRLVKSTASSVLGVEDLAAGLYVAKAGKTAVKVVVK